MRNVAARRTRKQKENPHRPFLYSWNQDSAKVNKNEPVEAHVKRESKIEAKMDNALITAKKDIVKSLLLASLILSLEVVIYLGWNKLMP